MDLLLERAALSGKVDTERGIIRGVRIIGPTSKNGRRYPADVLIDALPLYEGAKVFVDHEDSPRDKRSYAALIGRLENVTFRQGSLYGDLIVNLKHALAEQLLYDAEHSPGQVGLSHDAVGEIDSRGVVKAISVVKSVDLCWNPATVSGLFESVDESFDWSTFPESLREDSHDFTQASPVVTGDEAIREARANREQRAEQFLERTRANEHPADKAARLREAEETPFDFDNFTNSIRTF